MARGGSYVDADLSGIERLSARLDLYSHKEITQMFRRAAGTLSRRFPKEAARLVSERVLNVDAATIAPMLSAFASVVGDDVSVRLQGLRKRVPLHKFLGARWGGRETPGAVVKVWRDTPAETYSAARAAAAGKRGRGGVFAIVSRGGVSGGLFQRLKGSRQIARRSGPELWRAITDREHGDIQPELVEFGREVLREEIERLMQY
jgi:hypothetical protein